MKFKLEMTMDNAAFEGDYAEQEVIRILQDLRERMCNGDARIQREFTLHDINGNSVGTAKFSGKALG